MYKAIRLKLYPNKHQEQRLREHVGCSRFVYNHYLGEKIKIYTDEGESFTKYGQMKDLTWLKQQPDFQFLQGVSAASLQVSLINLDKAYQNFFNKRTGFPNFKRKGVRDSFTIPKSNPTRFSVDQNYLRLERIGWIKVRGNHNILQEHELQQVTVVQDCGSWYASVVIEIEDQVVDHEHLYESCGVDLGVVTPLTIAFFNGDQNDLTFKVSGLRVKARLLDKEIKRKRYQRSLARKVNGSENRNKAKQKLQRAYQKERNVRRDWIEKTSLKLVKTSKVIKFEDLKLKQMTKNKGTSKTGLNHGMLQLGLASLVQATVRKAERYGSLVEFVDPRNTSRECSCCGHTSKNNRKSQAIFSCTKCGHTENADRNAAVNILYRSSLDTA